MKKKQKKQTDYLSSLIEELTLMFASALDSTAKFQDFFNFSFAHAGFTSHHPPVMKYRERQFQFSAG